MKKTFLSADKESVLIDRVKGGDNEAWGILYESFTLPVRGFIAGRIGNIDDAEDLAQECFMRAKRTIDEGRFDRHYRFYTLLRGIAAHLAQDFWRSRTRHESGLPRDSTDGNGLQGDLGAVLLPMERLELLRLICMCFAKPHQIIAFVFVKLLEWRPREIVSERFRDTLSLLWDEFVKTYSEAVSEFVSESTIRDSYCSHLSAKLDLLVDQVYVEHEYARLVADHDCSVGVLTLEPFSGRDPAANISDWCDRVKNRTRKLLHSANIESKDGIN